MSEVNNTLIYDCQLLQTKAWHRGMGKYTAKLIAAFLSDKKCSKDYSEIVLLFNSRLQFSDELKKFCDINSSAIIKFLSLDAPLDGDQHSISQAQQANKNKLDDYVERTYPNSSVSFCITSLFLDEACPVFPTNTYNSLIFYDLIPLMYYRLYLGLGASEQYFTRFSVLFAADQIFSISETVANDIVTYLGIPKSKLINIRGASNTMSNDSSAKKPDLFIAGTFILMPTGGDPRKNNLNGVKGFALFNAQHDNKYQLILTSTFTEQQKDELNIYSDNLLFTGNVSDEELWWLYENSEILLFPTEYEGLGMPILEAIDAGKKIVCSNISVFREISTTAFYTFDPTSPLDMSNSIEEAITANPETTLKKMKPYGQISKLYTWKNTAEIVASKLLAKAPKELEQLPSIAIVTPNLCFDSEASRFIAQHYVDLSEHYNINFYYDVDSGALAVRPSYLAFVTRTYDIRDMTSEVYESFDLVVYIVSNSNKSIATLQAALAMPGLVVATDATLKHCYGGALRSGAISKQRYELEDTTYTNNLRSVSKAYVSTAAVNKGDTTVQVFARELAYPASSIRSLENVMFIYIDSTSDDYEWNRDFIKDIAQSIDKSRISITVATRTSMDESIYKQLQFDAVNIYEYLSDHEYNTLLIKADLYVDARPGNMLDKIYRADEAFKYGLNVFTNQDEDTAGWRKPTYYVAKDGGDLRKSTYKWLVNDMTATTVVGGQVSKAKSLMQIIDEALNGKSKKRGI